LLRAAGYEFEREGKGDHEIWRNLVTGKRVTLDVNCRKRHTANKILRDADLPKAF
jgi:predicted RNA binding protein YcfA (HicA-like mRNA interferase family)